MTCAIAGCEQRTYAKKLCRMHYDAARRLQEAQANPRCAPGMHPGSKANLARRHIIPSDRAQSITDLMRQCRGYCPDVFRMFYEIAMDESASKRDRVLAGLPSRTTRRHLTRLFEIGILEREHMFEGYRWHRRDISTLDERATAYHERLMTLLRTYERKRRTISSTLSNLAMMVLAI